MNGKTEFSQSIMLQFDGIYICFNGFTRVLRNGMLGVINTLEENDLILQFYKHGQFRSGMIPHHFTSIELREFIVTHAKKRMDSIAGYRQSDYYYLEWFYDILRYFSPKMNPYQLEPFFSGGLYYLDEDKIRMVNEGYQNITKHWGLVKKDCLDLQAKYPKSDSNVDEFYEFIAFHYNPSSEKQ